MGFVRKTYFGNTAGLTFPVSEITVKAVRRESKNHLGVNPSVYLSPQGKGPLGFINSNKDLYLVGNNSVGELGDETVVPKSSPTLVSGGLRWKRFSSSPLQAVGITENGAMYCWGNNGNGELGDGTTVISRSSPTLVIGGLKWVGLSTVTRDRNYGITESGDMYGWGWNSSGVLGDGTITDRSSPVLVLGGLKWNPSPNAFGNSGNIAWGITTSGDLYIWGDANNLNGTKTSSPVLVTGGLKWRLFRALGSQSFGITESGDAYTCGDNTDGVLGDGTVNATSSPVLVIGGLKWVSLCMPASSTTMAGLTTTGDIYVWGYGVNGQIGNGSSGAGYAVSSPTLVSGGLKFLKVEAGVTNNASLTYFTALTVDGDIYTWGSNRSGELGDGTTATGRSSPTLVVGGLKWSDFAVSRATQDFSGIGGGVTRAIATSGDMYAWGRSDYNDMGLGATSVRSSPTLVLGGIRPHNQDVVYTKQISVTPGQSYDLKIGQTIPMFGNRQIGEGPIDQVIIEYMQ